MADQNIKNTIHKRNELFMDTYKRSDSAGMAELYTENGQVLPPNADSIRGKVALKEFWKSIMNMGVKSVHLETGEVEQHGDTAIEVSKASLLGEDSQVIDDVKYIVIWKRENGEWKLHRDIFNSSRPAQIMKKGMIKVSVFYPNNEDTTFDMDYYCNTHVPMVRELLGDALKNLTIEKGIAGGAPDSPAPYAAMGNLYFDSVETFQNSFGPNADKIMGDLPNFTTVEPIVQVNEVMI